MTPNQSRNSSLNSNRNSRCNTDDGEPSHQEIQELSSNPPEDGIKIGIKYSQHS